MKTRAQLDERSFEELLAAAYLLQQRREPLPFASARPAMNPAASPSMNEAERLAAIAEAHAIVHGKQLRLQETLQLVMERALRITGGAGAAIWLARGPNAVCQAACGASAASVGQSISVEGSRLTVCLREGDVFRCADAASDPRTRYDALPGLARGSLVAVPIHYEGRVQGALEVTFAHTWGFGDADVRTCQILSGLVSETVAVAAGQERRIILETERTTLLEALDRLQPHLSRLLNDDAERDPVQNLLHGQAEETDETPLPPTGLPPAPTGPTHGLARLGKYLLDQQEQGGPASREGQNGAPQTGQRQTGPREVHTALNFAVAAQPTRDSRADASPLAEAHEFATGNRPSHDASTHDSEAQGFDVSQYDSATQRYYEHGPEHLENSPEPGERESRLLTPAYEPWAHAEVEIPSAALPLAEQTPAPIGFWRSRGADVCLAASIILFAASLIWAVWPQPKRIAASTAPAPTAATAPAEPKLSAFEEMLVTMGLAEAPAPPVTYAGNPGTRVWVDINSALYYCAGAEPYGKTPKGKFLTQREAQEDQFQPARGQPCE